MKRIFSVLFVAVAMLAFNATYAQTTNTGKTSAEKPACQKQHTSCASKAATSAQTETNTEQGSSKMVEAAGVSADGKPACANKSAACCKDKKGTASAEQGSTKMVEAAGVSAESKPACANKSAACCKDKKGTASTEQGSTKMVEAAGVSADAKPACANKSAACCKDKKTASSCDKDKKAETATPQD